MHRRLSGDSDDIQTGGSAFLRFCCHSDKRLCLQPRAGRRVGRVGGQGGEGEGREGRSRSVDDMRDQ